MYAGVVENVLCTEKFESTLTLLQPSCPSSIIMSNLVEFYRTLYASCKSNLYDCVYLNFSINKSVCVCVATSHTNLDPYFVHNSMLVYFIH